MDDNLHNVIVPIRYILASESAINMAIFGSLIYYIYFFFCNMQLCMKFLCNLLYFNNIRSSKIMVSNKLVNGDLSLTFWHTFADLCRIINQISLAKSVNTSNVLCFKDCKFLFSIELINRHFWFY